jgi:hypothetical protein
MRATQRRIASLARLLGIGLMAIKPLRVNIGEQFRHSSAAIRQMRLLVLHGSSV